MPGAGFRERGKQRRAERIVHAAMELLREQPELPLTVERISERAEVSVTTIFNLVGTRDHIWAAIANTAFTGLDELPGAKDADPQERARALVDSVISAVVSDSALFRSVYLAWAQSARVLDHDLIADVLHACLQDAGFDRVHIVRLAGLIGAGLNGVCHEWSAGLITDHQLRTLSRDLVDLAFVAARAANADPNPQWRLNR
jgi:AcrR family transcriptional regulator